MIDPDKPFQFADPSKDPRFNPELRAEQKKKLEKSTKWFEEHCAFRPFGDEW